MSYCLLFLQGTVITYKDCWPYDHVCESLYMYKYFVTDDPASSVSNDSSHLSSKAPAAGHARLLPTTGNLCVNYTCPNYGEPKYNNYCQSCYDRQSRTFYNAASSPTSSRHTFSTFPGGFSADVPRFHQEIQAQEIYQLTQCAFIGFFLLCAYQVKTSRKKILQSRTLFFAFSACKFSYKFVTIQP